ncbi:MAG TPA: STAS domain-containing protein [Candidatus Eisenbacteria bacterium]|jgi:anti-sigma B factor antagonist|nr:STAS domain-containing protein [Candidatus Eisenbacteria bacterium]
MKGIDVYVEEAAQNPAVSILRVSGYVDTTTSPDLERRLQALLKEKRFHIVVDLASVEYISSAGWGIFISEIREIRENGGDLKLAGMIADVREVFDLLEFENILKAYADSEQAVVSFGAVAGSPSSSKSSTPAASGAPGSQPEGPQRSEVVLSDEDLIREIARQHPEFGLMRIQRELRRPERGSRDLNPVQIYVLLRKLDLDTKERREAFARSAQPTSR